MGFEPVYTVSDYYDGPRSGIAAYAGQPHHFRCEWNETADDYADTFILSPIDDETLSLALEQWTIWRAWERAFHRGEVSQATHPALPGVHPRYAELEGKIQARMPAPVAGSKRARATFRAQPGQLNIPQGVMRDLEVEWSEVGCATLPKFPPSLG